MRVQAQKKMNQSVDPVDERHSIDEPPIQHVADKLKHRYDGNQWPLDRYRIGFERLLEHGEIEDLAHRDGITSFVSSNLDPGCWVAYGLTGKAGFQIGKFQADVPLSKVDMSFAAKCMHIFEECSENPKKYFMYRFLESSVQRKRAAQADNPIVHEVK